MTISQAIQYNEATDSQVDAPFVAKWSDTRHAELVAKGMDSAAAWSRVYAELDAIEAAGV